MKHLILALFALSASAVDVSLAIDHLAPAAKYRGSLTANTEKAYNAIQWKDARAKPTWAELEAAQVDIDAVKATAAAKEATRLTKRPKRSQINSAMAATAGAKTVPELRAAVAELMVLLNNVLSYQKVDIEEDE